MVRLNDKGGVEYGIRRRADGMFALIEDVAAREVEWVDDPDLASTWPTAPECVETVAAYGLAVDESESDDEWRPRVADGYELVEIPWINEEDIQPDAGDLAAREMGVDIDNW